MLKFDLRVKLGRVTSGAKIAVSAFKIFQHKWWGQWFREDQLI